MTEPSITYLKPNITEQESAVLASLSKAWELYVALPDKHPDDDLEFRLAIHAAQNLIAFRAARRLDPDVWWQPPSA